MGDFPPEMPSKLRRSRKTQTSELQFSGLDASPRAGFGTGAATCFLHLLSATYEWLVGQDVHVTQFASQEALHGKLCAFGSKSYFAGCVAMSTSAHLRGSINVLRVLQFSCMGVR